MPPTRYGGFWIRFVAAIIDALVVGIVVVPISAIISLMIGAAGDVVSMPGIGVTLVRIIVSSAFSTCAHWIYEAFMESSSRQATLGKMALGLKVTDLEGGRISFVRATGRHFSKILSGMVLLIGFIMAGFTPRKQALHDLIAGTFVVHAL
ncbi:MAG: RDD family protein [Acidobacteria bacterium]|nr:RDD family protein [Acidobacteriota bacterium]